MADMRWTPGQEDAIQARNGTVLVAAAAGSGKTAVLVQRAIERLTDPEHPAPAQDHLPDDEAGKADDHHAGAQADVGELLVLGQEGPG